MVAIGLLIAAFGATAGAALITVSRAELTRAVGRRLRGATPSLGWLAQVDADLTAASATTSLGVLIVGAALPALLAGSGTRRLVVLLALVGVPLVLLRGLPGSALAHAAAGARRRGPGDARAAAVEPGARPGAAGPHREAAHRPSRPSGARAPPSDSGPTTSW